MGWKNILRRASRYGRKPPLVLINGLAEQAETWFRNVPAWRRHFEIYMPNILSFDGEALHERIDSGRPVDIEYLVEQLRLYLRTFVQTPPYFLGGSSTGGKVVVEYAVRYPQDVSRLVLFGPSGLSSEERMPIIEGVRRSDARALVDSVFHKRRKADRNLLRYYKDRLNQKKWKIGVLRSVRGTLGHSIKDQLARLTQPTLMIFGENDRIVNPMEAKEAALNAPAVRYVGIPKCGHAPHQEKARYVNRQVIKFLKAIDRRAAQPTPVAPGANGPVE